MTNHTPVFAAAIPNVPDGCNIPGAQTAPYYTAAQVSRRYPSVRYLVSTCFRSDAFLGAPGVEIAEPPAHTLSVYRPFDPDPEKPASMPSSTPLPASVDATATVLADERYIADRSLATAVFLALKLGRPLFLEGEAGVGKTEIAKVLASALGRRLIRLQCYEGLDIASAVYEWNYARQMLEIRLAEGGQASRAEIQRDIFDERFLIKRPLLQALEPNAGGAPVLLIDELDRTDEPFEAYLLEVLSDFQVTIPEIGTVKAAEPPIVIITSNRTREIHDALKRRCFYHWVDYPSAARELEILKVKAPEASQALSREVVGFVQALRKLDLFKQPGVAETIDWAEALMQLDALTLSPEAINDTLGVILKYQDDIQRLQGSEAQRLLEQVKAELGGQTVR